MADKAEFDCAPCVPKENGLTDSEIDALKRSEPPEDVDVSTKARVARCGQRRNIPWMYLRFSGRKNPEKLQDCIKPEEVETHLLDAITYNLETIVICTSQTYLVDDMVGAEAATHHALRRIGYRVQVPGGGTEWYGVNRNQES